MIRTRREFLVGSAAAGAAAGLSVLGSNHVHASEPLANKMPRTEKLGWRVGFSAYSFRTISVYESLEKMAATDLRYTELFAWQKLSPANPDARPDASLSKTLKKDLKNKARDCGVTMVGCYTGLDSQDAARAFFDFAADMDFEFIVSEPAEKLLDTIEELTDEYKVDLALHNHPKPSHYWNPETGSAALKGRSARMGFCCDTGHWCRCGLDPVAMLKMVGPRVKAFHLKDLDEFGVPGAKDVIWGQGKGRIAEILSEVKTQGIPRPYFGIEWERTSNEPLETHSKSAAFFEQVARRLTG